MRSFLFKDARVLDGSGAAPFAADVLVTSNRIADIAEPGVISTAGVHDVIQCAGATLMPGLIEPHAHLSFVDQATPFAFHAIPVEEHLLLTLKHARLYLDQGFTSLLLGSGDKATPRHRGAQRDRLRGLSWTAPARRQRATNGHRRSW
jgi:imidazolonepropionase-like amidohydrolase